MSQIELKADLHARIDTMDERHLAIVERVLLTLEIEKMNAMLESNFESDRRAGLLTDEKVEAAIAQARAARPYR